MTASVDLSRLQERLSRLAALASERVPVLLPDVALNVLLRSGYADPDADESGAGADTDLLGLVTDVQVGQSSATVGILQLYDWALTEPHQHCQFCLEAAQGGPYTADFPYRPETAPSHNSKNPCWCVWAPRAIDLTEHAAAAFRDLGEALSAEMEATWTRT